MNKDMRVTRISRGKYEIQYQGAVWSVWHSFASGRWRGESRSHPGKALDAKTLACAKYDLANGYLVNCSSAGL